MAAVEGDDLRLLRAAPSLLEDLTASLQRLIWKSKQGSRKFHTKAREADVDKIVTLLEPFQEDPQILDTHLKVFLPDIVSAFLHNVVLASTPVSLPGTVPLASAICKILYVLCKVRGYKIIVSFLSNEPKYLEPVLSWLESRHYGARTSGGQASGDSQAAPLSWHERYVTLLWLSHLMLTPFDLSTLSTSGYAPFHSPQSHVPETPHDLPSVAARVVPLCVYHLQQASKDRDAAALLLVRLAVRPDMQKAGLLHLLVEWALGLLNKTTPALANLHFDLGLLRFLSVLVSNASKDEISELLPRIRRTLRRIVVEDQSSALWTSAVARSLAIKIMRTMVVHSLQPGHFDMDATQLLEDVIDYILREALADRDTPVRYAASKGLSMITLQLDPDMAAEVIEAILGSYTEDVIDTDSSKDLSSVDPLRWHGLTLTVAQLLYRRAVPSSRMQDLLNALLLALNFEQRSATGSSVGSNVRDAACFGIWSLARRYSTEDLTTVDIAQIQAVRPAYRSLNALQVLAMELLTAACLDPHGNIRRGSSAALQELIGRHPDTITEGISLVQVVDFHAVGLRDRALNSVATEASKLDAVYWEVLFTELLGWRGLRSPDAPSRLAAATSIGNLSSLRDIEGFPRLFDILKGSLAGLRPREVEERHGVLTALARLIESFQRKLEHEGDVNAQLNVATEVFQGFWTCFYDLGLPDSAFTSFALRPELTATSVCSLTTALANLTQFMVRTVDIKLPDEHLEAALRYLNLSIQRPEDAVLQGLALTVGSLTAVMEDQRRETLIQSWLTKVRDGMSNQSSRDHGTVIALGSAYSHAAHENLQATIVDTLSDICRSNHTIETKVIALRSLKLTVSSTTGQDTEKAHAALRSLSPVLELMLNDYTITERGDMGSLVRFEAIDVIEKGLTFDGTVGETWDSWIVAPLVRLALEKLDRIRPKAVHCLQQSPAGQNLDFSHLNPLETSSFEYFSNFLVLLSRLPRYETQKELILGYFNSAALGSASVAEASREALVEYLEVLPVSSADQFSMQTFGSIVLDLFRENLENDRVVIPLLEMVGFLLEFQVLQRLGEDLFKWRTLLYNVQKAHFKSTNIAKLAVAISCYHGLATVAVLRRDALAKLTSMLVHPFPKVRTDAAETLFLLTRDADLKQQDWSLPIKSLKSLVQEKQKTLKS